MVKQFTSVLLGNATRPRKLSFYKITSYLSTFFPAKSCLMPELSCHRGLGRISDCIYGGFAAGRIITRLESGKAKLISFRIEMEERNSIKLAQCCETKQKSAFSIGGGMCSAANF